MTNEELTMLRCLVEHVEQTTDNTFIRGHNAEIHGDQVYDQVSIESCRRWLESEQYKYDGEH